MLSIKKPIATTLFTILILAANAQTPKIDSLEALLAKHKREDTAKVDLLNDLAYEIRLNDPQKARVLVEKSSELSSQCNYSKGKAAGLWVAGLIIVREDKKTARDYFQQALKIAEQIGDSKGICNYTIAIAGITEQQDINASLEAYGQALLIAREIDDQELIIKCLVNISRISASDDPINAVKHLHEAVLMAEQIGNDKLHANCYEALGKIYRYQGNLQSALEYLQSALHLHEKTQNQIGAFYNLVNVSSIYFDQKEFDMARQFLQKAQEIAGQNDEPMLMAICYVNMGNILYQQKLWTEALEYFQKSMAISKDRDIPLSTSTLASIGTLYTQQGEYAKATVALDQALELAKKIRPQILGEVYGAQGALYLKQNKYDRAMDWLRKALDFSEKIGYVDLQKDCNRQLASIYAISGDYKRAYTHHIQYKALFDSLYNEKHTREITLLESSYRFAKEREAYELEKTGRELRIRSQQQTILSLGLISLLVFSLAIVVYWSGRLRKKVLKLEIEKMNRELEVNQKAMAVAKLKLIQNSEREAHHVRMLEDIQERATGSEVTLGSLISNYKLQANQSNWEEFETLFTKVNASFWGKLNELSPTLTPNERKLCVFLKLNMGNKDIALITFQSEEALKKSRLRLRKKFDLDRSTNLIAFIQNL